MLDVCATVKPTSITFFFNQYHAPWDFDNALFVLSTDLSICLYISFHFIMI